MSEGLRRRIAVDQSKEVSNPSLELQRYVEKIESGGGSTAKDKLFERVSGSKATEIYRKAYERWKSNLELMQATIVEVRCSNRVIVGLASENVLEASITLHPITSRSSLLAILSRKSMLTCCSATRIQKGHKPEGISAILMPGGFPTAIRLFGR
jgi:hypothetical protein